MLQLHNISVTFGGQRILDGLTWTVRLGQRIGLIGPNGAGKTTLLRLMDGRIAPDEGSVARGRLEVGFLEQDVQEDREERSVVDETLTAFDRVQQLERREHEITLQLDADPDHESPEYHRLLHELDDIHIRMAGLDSHLSRPRAEAVLSGLGFEADDLERPLNTFSGGWRMRVALAKLLLQRPDILLLDEPTNHLDIDSIAWLEDYLKSYDGTVVIVSHDRYFLDRMVTTIAELAYGRITEYAGNYSYYLEERGERRALHQAAYENQQKQIAETERFIERFRYKATKARQVQSRIKMLEKLERIPPPPTDDAGIRFRFPEPQRSGRAIIELSEFSKVYSTAEGRIHVFGQAGPLTIERGEKIALIGKNGAGKSTLARMLRGTEPFEGQRRLGYNVEVAFFAQHQAEDLDPTLTVLESLRERSRGHSETELRSLLGAFLFTGEDVEKKVGVLSGGERSRLALARTLLVPANFLILDEPTNHLDIQSIKVLSTALKQFSGTFVVVSHDRHFLDQVVNRVLRVEDGDVKSFIGNYTDYRWQVEHGTASRFESLSSQESDEPDPAEQSDSRAGGPKTKEQKRREAEERNRRYREQQNGSSRDLTEIPPQRLRLDYEAVEAEIIAHERRKGELEEYLGDPSLYQDDQAAQRTTAEYEAVQQRLAQLYQRWEALAARLAHLDLAE